MNAPIIPPMIAPQPARFDPPYRLREPAREHPLERFGDRHQHADADHRHQADRAAWHEQVVAQRRREDDQRPREPERDHHETEQHRENEQNCLHSTKLRCRARQDPSGPGNARAPHRRQRVARRVDPL